MLRHDTHDIEHGQARSASFPPEATPWAAVLLNNIAGWDISNALSVMGDDELRDMVVHIQLCEIRLPRLLDTLGLPQLEETGFWGGRVLVEIRAELTRRSMPGVSWIRASKSERRQSRPSP